MSNRKCFISKMLIFKARGAGTLTGPCSWMGATGAAATTAGAATATGAAATTAGAAAPATTPAGRVPAFHRGSLAMPEGAAAALATTADRMVAIGFMMPGYVKSEDK